MKTNLHIYIYIYIKAQRFHHFTTEYLATSNVWSISKTDLLTTGPLLLSIFHCKEEEEEKNSLKVFGVFYTSTIYVCACVCVCSLSVTDPTPYNVIKNVLTVSLNKTFPSATE